MHRPVCRIVPVVLFLLAGVRLAGAESAARLPIVEITAFKDGHAMVHRAGPLATGSRGEVVLDDLPAPILGAIWGAARGADLAAIRAGHVDVERERPARTPVELVRANVGRRVLIGGVPKEIVRVLDADPGQVHVALRDPTGWVDVLPIGGLQPLRFEDVAALDAAGGETIREPRLTFELAWDDTPPATADVDLLYVQRGLRWIPSYRVELGDGGTARMHLQATLVNELADFENAALNLVVGVPTFHFEHTIDPMALQSTFAELGPYFDKASGTSRALSNALMSQTARMQELRRDAVPAMNAPDRLPEMAGTEHREELFIFRVEGVSLAKGERMVLPLGYRDVDFERVYKLDVPIAPPADALRHFNTDQQRRIAELLDRPTAREVIRIRNEADRPITTAPALVLSGGRPIAQQLITYAAIGGTVDLEVTDAVDLRVEHDHGIVHREPSALVRDGTTYARLTTAGSIELESFKREPVRIEVRHGVLGIVDEIGAGGTAIERSIFDRRYWGDHSAVWWRWYAWPWWWHELNGVTELRWTIELEPGATRELTWSGHYHWR